MNKYRPYAEQATRKAADETRKRFRPWAFVIVILATIALAVCVGVFVPQIHPAMIISAVVPMVAGQLLLGYLAFVRAPRPPDAP